MFEALGGRPHVALVLPVEVRGRAVVALYGEHFEIQRLETREVLNDAMRARGLSAMSETTYKLTRRAD